MSGRFDALLKLDKPVKKDSAAVQNVHKSASGQVDKWTSPQDRKDANPQEDKSASGQVDKFANEKAERYSTRLQPSLIKRTKRYAFEHDMNDYDVVQQALVEFLEKREKDR